MTNVRDLTDFDLGRLSVRVSSEQRRRELGRVCEWCGNRVVGNAGKRFCSGRCRVANHRAQGAFPEVLRLEKRWVRRTSSKIPLTVEGRYASSTEPADWSWYEDARASTAGVGLGYMVGGGISVYDLDHCAPNGVLTDDARDYLTSLDAFYVEWSPSGEGVHAFVFDRSPSGWRRTIGNLSVEFYPWGRHITMTGKPIREFGVAR